MRVTRWILDDQEVVALRKRYSRNEGEHDMISIVHKQQVEVREEARVLVAQATIW